MCYCFCDGPTTNLRAKIMDLRGFDSSRILIIIMKAQRMTMDLILFCHVCIALVIIVIIIIIIIIIMISSSSSSCCCYCSMMSLLLLCCCCLLFFS